MTVSTARTWADDIDRAMRAGNSPYSALSVIGWLRSGNASFACHSSGLHASVVFWSDGTAEIGHICGKWSREGAEWLMSRLQNEMAWRNVKRVEYRGRAGWRRFLRLKGILT